MLEFEKLKPVYTKTFVVALFGLDSSVSLFPDQA